MRALLSILLGLSLGLLVVEAVFWWRDDGAFPHVNVYVPDSTLGARLRPGATQRFALGDNPLSEIAINSDGLRGKDLSSPSSEEILVVGDSQVFGLGVNDHETFSARLAQLTHTTVINAGVPTYGPLEYNAMAKEWIDKRRPKLVIYTVNMLNDLFEHDRPNTQRHAVWDGWAVRRETAPREATIDFPGRRWWMSQSHAVYALRRYLHGQDKDETRYASEGTWDDLLSDGKTRAEAIAKAEAAATPDAAQIAKLDEQILQAMNARSNASGNKHARYRLERDIAVASSFIRAHPGDIVIAGDAESSRPIHITAEIIAEATAKRDQAIAQLARLTDSERHALQAAIKTHEDLKAQRRALIAKHRKPRRPTSVLYERLRELRDLCDARGVEAMVIALPIDVQVSPDEWRKYDAKPIDMSATLALADDLLHTAAQLGMRTLDALPALKAAEPGAFLDRDIHMTAKGHAALAQAIVEALKQPAPTRQPQPGLPAGHTYPPSIDYWYLGVEHEIDNSADTNCRAATQDEWLTIQCPRHDEETLLPSITNASVLSGGHGQTNFIVDDNSLYVVSPLFADDELTLRFEWERSGMPARIRHETATLTATRAALSDAPRLRISVIERGPFDEAAQQRAWQTAAPGQWSRLPFEQELWFKPQRPECQTLEVSQAGHARGCIQGEPDHQQPCPVGSVHGDAFGRCLAICSAARACERGTCQPWQGVHVCRAVP